MTTMKIIKATTLIMLIITTNNFDNADKKDKNKSIINKINEYTNRYK